MKEIKAKKIMETKCDRKFKNSRIKRLTTGEQFAVSYQSFEEQLTGEIQEKSYECWKISNNLKNKLKGQIWTMKGRWFKITK